MGCWACKTSHLGKNTLKNRRFLESNNADSGEQVQGLPKSGAELWFRCWRGAESESRLVSPAGCRPVLATDAAISSLFFLEMMPFRQHPHTCLGKLASALVRTGPCLSLSPERCCLPPESSLCTCGPPFWGLRPACSQPGHLSPSRLDAVPPSAQGCLIQASGLTLLQTVPHMTPCCSTYSPTAVLLFGVDVGCSFPLE